MNPENVRAECWFLDVGQGSSQVIDLGDGSAIVIDCGRSPQTLVQHLSEISVDRIALLVLTHNHLDHVGGTIGLVRKYRRQIDAIYFLQDRPSKELTEAGFYSFLRQEQRLRNVGDLRRLEVDERNPILYQAVKDSASPVNVELLFPRFTDNLEGQQDEPNATSGVLLVSWGDRRILYPGDAKANVWDLIHQRRDKAIHCDVLVVPHHGGQLIRQKRRGETDQQFYRSVRPAFDKMYTKIIDADYAVVSAGSSNTYGHPMPCHLDALRESVCNILCTQITRTCCDNLERLRPGILQPMWAGKSVATPSKTDKDRSRDVACAGTILAQIGFDVEGGKHEKAILIDRFDQHVQNVVDKLSELDSRPRCREPIREMEQLLTRAIGEEMIMVEWSPPLVIETEDEYLIRAEFPNAQLENLMVTVIDGQIVLKESRAENEENQQNYYRIESSHGGFPLSVSLPDDVNVEEIKAEYAHGTLTVRLPKDKEPPQQSVEVKPK